MTKALYVLSFFCFQIKTNSVELFILYLDKDKLNLLVLITEFDLSDFRYFPCPNCSDEPDYYNQGYYAEMRTEELSSAFIWY